MAIAAPTPTTFNSDVTSHPINIPTCSNGDYLLCYFNFMVNALTTLSALSDPSGWTIGAQNQDPYVPFTSIGWAHRKTDGSDSGGTIDFATSQACFGCAQMYRIPAADWDGSIANAIGSTSDQYYENLSNPDPASLSHSFGATQTNIYPHFIGFFSNGYSVSASPTNYGANGPYSTETSRGDQEVQIISDFRQAATATSEDVGAYNMGGSTDGSIFSNAIKGPSAGGGGNALHNRAGVGGGLVGMGGLAGPRGGLVGSPSLWVPDGRLAA